MSIDSIERAFNALSDGEAYLSKESFIKNMKKYKISLFARLNSDSPDYETSCTELFQVFTSQFEEPSPNLKFARQSSEELPDFLQFMQSSIDRSLKPSSIIPKGVEGLTKEQFV